ncbi:MAG: DUF4956 domain-containing protein [Thermoanaerobaculia bacterium]|nr:DUF4956 domain-containing protein [Thermoanaerobaculia bacterium]
MSESEGFFARLLAPGDPTYFTLVDVVLAMSVATALCFLLAFTYRRTHRGTSYSQSFLITLFVMGVVTSIVMMIIGSNIARAFSLVGALSIIRFRTAVKDPRDTGFLFAAVIVGMGCGTSFYMAVVVMTVFVCALILLLYHFDYGVKQRLESIVRVGLKDSPEVQAAVESVLNGAFREASLVNRILDLGQDEATHVYVVRPRRDSDFEAVEERLRQIDGVVSLSRYQTDQHAPV